jgi:SAM-dependent methyltransferase
MMRRLERRAREQAPLAKVLRAPAEDLPFEDATFDVAVSTMVLCGVSDQPRALRQLRRVLRPGGQLLFIEHVRSGDPRLARHQDRMNWMCQAVMRCDCNRPTLTSIEEAGFAVTHVGHLTLAKAPSFVSPLIVGSATAPTGAAADLQHIAAATRPGGHVVMAHYEPPPDPLPRTTMRLRTIRDGGSVLDSGSAAGLLRGAGCLDVYSLTRTWPIPFGFVTGQKA